MKVEPASDSALLASLHARCFAESWTAQAFESLLAAHSAAARIARDESANPCGLILTSVAADDAEILTIGIAPEYRRKGLGRELVLAAAADVFARGARTLFLEVDAANAPAL